MNITLPIITASHARIGRKVIITFNPFHQGCEGVTGTIVSAPEPGPFDTRLVHVRYINPADGAEHHEMPFGLANLSAGDAEALEGLADYYEAIAAELRQMASKG